MSSTTTIIENRNLPHEWGHGVDDPRERPRKKYFLKDMEENK
jgi:hypothetical protein